MGRKRALITGITGQDGSYLAELLLKKDYDVFGIIRRSSSPNPWRIEHLLDRRHTIRLIQGDMTDETSLDRVVRECEPDEVYNLAAQSFVPESWTQPLYTSDVTGMGATRLLEVVRRGRPEARVYNAGSSEMYGNANRTPQDENTPFMPRSPYGVAKAYAYQMTKVYRESYGLFCCSGILFNHESPRRGLEFVTRKISWGVAQAVWNQKRLTLGNVKAYRDWGFAGDYVNAMWRMLQQEKPRDFVIATNKAHPITEFLEIAFKKVDEDWRNWVDHDEAFERPAELHYLQGDYGKADKILGWCPSMPFETLVGTMVEADLKRIEGGFSHDKVLPV